MQYFMLFLEGVITFISPCLLPMIPVYLMYFAAQNQDGKKKAWSNALAFVAGFTVVFVALGALAGTLSSFLIRYQTAVNIVTGAIVVVLGFNFLGVFKIGFLNKTSSHKMNTKSKGLLASFLFGLVFSISWTPCVGAFLSSALMLAASQGSMMQGIVLLLCYSVGLGVPFVASAILIEKLENAFNWIKKHYTVINVISGLFLVLMGILIMTGLMGKWMALLSF